MCYHTNQANNGRYDCQCPYRENCERYGYRENYRQNANQNCRGNERREYRARECNFCSLFNIFRRNCN